MKFARTFGKAGHARASTDHPGGTISEGHPITILFTDVQGSTQLRARHGDRVADEMLGDHEAIVRRAIGAHGGTEVAFFGDGFLATFDTPAARSWSPRPCGRPSSTSRPATCGS